MEAEEFEAQYSAKKDEEFPEELGGEELLIQQDVIDAILLFKKVKTLLDYVSNTELCKTVTKREREVMAKISTEVSDYLESTAGNYEEEE